MSKAPPASIRLQKVIAQAGLASRRRAEEMIRQGRVHVNGHLVTALGTTVDANRDDVVVDGRRLRSRAPMRYMILHKPTGCVTTADDEKGRPTVFDLLKRQPVRLFPVGRLDFNTEGLLLLTNDGPLANRLLHPRYGTPRVYLVRVNGTVAERDLEPCGAASICPTAGPRPRRYTWCGALRRPAGCGSRCARGKIGRSTACWNVAAATVFGSCSALAWDP